MTDPALTDLLVERVLEWKATRDRFIKTNRAWLPKWRFAPLTNLEDAFQLLDKLNCRYKIECTSRLAVAVEVYFQGRVGRSSGPQKARAIAFAVARVLELLPGEKQ